MAVPSLELTWLMGGFRFGKAWGFLLAATQGKPAKTCDQSAARLLYDGNAQGVAKEVRRLRAVQRPKPRGAGVPAGGPSTCQKHFVPFRTPDSDFSLSGFPTPVQRRQRIQPRCKVELLPCRRGSRLLAISHRP